MPNPNSRDDVPNYGDRVRRMGDLLAAPALPIADVALLLDIPLSTIDKLRSRGQGPRCFRIGRRLYTRQSDLRVWLDHLADEPDDGTDLDVDDETRLRSVVLAVLRELGGLTWLERQAKQHPEGKELLARLTPAQWRALVGDGKVRAT